MKLQFPNEPAELKAWMQALHHTQPKISTSNNWDSYVVWAGNRLPKYLWGCWKQDLKSDGYTWQRFMRTLRYRTDLGVMWYREAITWQVFVQNMIELINGPLGRNLSSNSAKIVYHAQTVNVPIVGTIAAGKPIFAEQNIEGNINISTDLAKPGFKYFVLHVKGDSMDQASLKDGDFALVRQQSMAEEGDKVVALINDEATVKEFHREKGIVILKPRSTNAEHKLMILTEDFQIQGVIIATIPKPVFK
jgi:repressor LexA